MQSELPQGWTCGRLGDYIELLPGFAFKSAQFTDDPGGVRLLRGDNVGQGRLRWDGARRWPHTEVSSLERYELREGDVVLAMDRPWIEAGLKCAIVRKEDLPALLVQRVARIRAARGVAQRYLTYVIASPAFTSYVRAIQTGTAVPHISGGQIADFPVRLPSVQEQVCIASVLGALDDKIDGNCRLASLLEEIAAAVFRARFVDFVGVENFEASEIGRIPAGWSSGAMADIAVISKESLLPSALPDAQYEHFSIPAFDDGRRPSVTTGQAMLSSKTGIPDGDCVLISKLNPATQRVWWPKPAGIGRPVCSPEFMVLVPGTGVPNSFLYTLLVADERLYSELLSHVTGTTGSRQRVRPADLMGCRVVIPDASALREWDEVMRPLFDLRHLLFAESRSLASLRDVLLPELVSGKVLLDDANGDEKAVRSVDELTGESV
jgi:type I restriction enzyme, S subunit